MTLQLFLGARAKSGNRFWGTLVDLAACFEEQIAFLAGCTSSSRANSALSCSLAYFPCVSVGHVLDCFVIPQFEFDLVNVDAFFATFHAMELGF